MKTELRQWAEDTAPTLSFIERRDEAMSPQEAERVYWDNSVMAERLGMTDIGGLYWFVSRASPARGGRLLASASLREDIVYRLDDIYKAREALQSEIFIFHREGCYDESDQTRLFAIIDESVLPGLGLFDPWKK